MLIFAVDALSALVELSIFFSGPKTENKDLRFKKPRVADIETTVQQP